MDTNGVLFKVNQVCINNVSLRYLDVLRSNFVESFMPGVFDPVALEVAGEAIL
jgi:hypothetical protein